MVELWRGEEVMVEGGCSVTEPADCPVTRGKKHKTLHPSLLDCLI